MAAPKEPGCQNSKLQAGSSYRVVVCQARSDGSTGSRL